VTRTRFLLQGLLKLLVASLCLVGAIAAYRLLVHPAIERATVAEPRHVVHRPAHRHLRRDDSLVRGLRPLLRASAHHASWRFAPLWTLLAAIAGVVSIGVTIGASTLTGHYEVVATRGLGAAGSVLGTLSVAAVLEELAFRCILFRVLEERIGTNLALVVSALVFGVVHLSNNGAGAVTLITVTEAGLMWGLVFVLTRNLWASAAHHFCWNSTIFLIGLRSRVNRTCAPVPRSRLCTAAPRSGPAARSAPRIRSSNVFVSAVIVYLMWRRAARRGQLLAARRRRRTARPSRSVRHSLASLVEGCYLEVVPKERLYGPMRSARLSPSQNAFFTAVVTFEPRGSGTRYTAIAIHKDEETRKKHEEMASTRLGPGARSARRDMQKK
jgi:membrane protease YdiL (CAAX protease family)